jgi:hypothetical protein
LKFEFRYNPSPYGVSAGEEGGELRGKNVDKIFGEGVLNDDKCDLVLVDPGE